MANNFNTENKEGFEKLKEAFSLSDKEYLDSLELPSENEIRFSKRYQSRMERLKTNQKRPYWKLINTAGKKACAIIFAVLVLFGGAMSMEATRVPVVGFIEIAYEKFSELFVNHAIVATAPDTIEEVYTLTLLPEGYVEISCDISEKRVITQWSNGFAILDFMQYTMDISMTIDTENSDYTKITHNNMEIVYVCKNKLTGAFWRNNEYCFSVYWHGEVPIEDMIELIDSLEIK